MTTLKDMHVAAESDDLLYGLLKTYQYRQDDLQMMQELNQVCERRATEHYHSNAAAYTALAALAQRVLTELRQPSEAY